MNALIWIFIVAVIAIGSAAVFSIFFDPLIAIGTAAVFSIFFDEPES